MSPEKKVSAPSIPEIDRLIHAPARLIIMKLLYVLDGADMVYLKRETSLSWGNLSVQIKKLEDAGYLKIIKEFLDNKPHTLVKLTKDGQIAFEEYRSGIKSFLDE